MSQKGFIVAFLGGLDKLSGRPTSLTIHLTPAERQTLLAWRQDLAPISVGQARRGRMILLVADSVPIAHVAVMVGISRRHVYKWVQRFLKEGLQGLAAQPRHDRKSHVPLAGHGRGRTPSPRLLTMAWALAARALPAEDATPAGSVARAGCQPRSRVAAFRCPTSLASPCATAKRCGEGRGAPGQGQE